MPPASLRQIGVAYAAAVCLPVGVMVFFLREDLITAKIGAVLLSLGIAAVITLVAWVIRAERVESEETLVKAGLCPFCKYDRRAINRERRCSECGRLPREIYEHRRWWLIPCCCAVAVGLAWRVYFQIIPIGYPDPAPLAFCYSYDAGFTSSPSGARPLRITINAKRVGQLGLTRVWITEQTLLGKRHVWAGWSDSYTSPARQTPCLGRLVGLVHVPRDSVARRTAVCDRVLPRARPWEPPTVQRAHRRGPRCTPMTRK
jgi:hypothetical protein